MKHLPRRPKGLLTILQVLTVIVGVFGTWLAVMMELLGLGGASMIFQEAETTVGGKVFVVGALAAVAVVSVCCYVTQVSFFLLLQRMKKETAFTRRNCKALGRMALCCLIASVPLFLLMGYMAVGTLTPGNITRGVWQLLDVTCVLLAWPFGFLMVSLLLQGVRVLMVRAMSLQEEQALVI
ncbi:MAG: DUF2975 domain-containing protein [Christensenellaceae bacterium]|nr:DUF2975 domain-containing protein [Christensenellaceae bacterium]